MASVSPAEFVADNSEERPQRRLIANESELIQRENTQPDAINELAIQVLNRVQSKLTGIPSKRRLLIPGHDFKPTVELNVPTQVDKLIEAAHSLENLCILYVGWCPVSHLYRKSNRVVLVSPGL
jgi:serine/threonine-protein kinase mTOR